MNRRTPIGTAGQRPLDGELAGQQELTGMPAGLYPCTPSRLATVRDCRRRYRFAYLDRPAPPPGAPWAHRSMGAAIHTALARWWSLPLPARRAAAGSDLVRAHWQHAGFRDQAQSEALRDRAAGWVGRYLTGLDPAAEPVAVERTVAATTATMTVSGRADRIDLADGALVVVDYKSGRRVPTDRDARSSLQLALYAVATARTLRLPVARVELHHVPTGTVAVAQHEAAWQAQALARAASLALVAAGLDAVHGSGQAGAETFPPSPSAACSWCDFRRHCPPGRSAAPGVASWAGLPVSAAPPAAP